MSIFLDPLQIPKLPTHPAAPPAGFVYVYALSDNNVYRQDPTGAKAVETPIGWRNHNIVINGDFSFAQRQVPGTLTSYTNTTTRTYAADRFWIVNENSGSQFQRVDTSTTPETGLNPRFYGKFKKITAAGKLMVGQFIEASNIAHLRGRTVRVQMKMKFSIAASMTVRLGLAQLANAGTVDTFPSPIVTALGVAGTDPTLATNVSYIAPNASPSGDGGTINGNAMDCVLTSAWVRYSATFNVPSNCKNLAVLVWSNGQPAINDELNISEVGLYEGQEIRDWFPRVPSVEYLSCQRYFCKTFAPDVAPAQNAGVSGALRSAVAIAAAVATSSTLQWRFPATMRAAPALTFYNPSAANAFMRNVPGATDATVTAAANTSTDATDINATGAAGWTVGQEIKVHASADAEL